MQHEPESTDPTTNREPDEDEARGLDRKEIPRMAEDVEAHNWVNKPPIVDSDS
jgi:hypothetical protein